MLTLVAIRPAALFKSSSGKFEIVYKLFTFIIKIWFEARVKILAITQLLM